MLQSEIDYFLKQALEEDELAAVATELADQNLHLGVCCSIQRYAVRAQASSASDSAPANA